MRRGVGVVVLVAGLWGGEARADRIPWPNFGEAKPRFGHRTRLTYPKPEGTVPPMPSVRETATLVTLGVVLVSATVGFAWMARRHRDG